MAIHGSAMRSWKTLQSSLHRTWKSLELLESGPVVVVLPSCAEWAMCFCGAVKLACPFISINSAIASRANELQDILSAMGKIGAMFATIESIVELHFRSAPAEIRKVGIQLVSNSGREAGWKFLGDGLATS